MKNFDYYKMVIEMLDKLYEHEGFQEWYNSLDISVEDQIEKDLEPYFQKEKDPMPTLELMRKQRRSKSKVFYL